MDSDYGIPRELSPLQKERALYQPGLPPCLQVFLFFCFFFFFLRKLLVFVWDLLSETIMMKFELVDPSFCGCFGCSKDRECMLVLGVRSGILRLELDFKVGLDMVLKRETVDLVVIWAEVEKRVSFGQLL